MGFHSLKVLGTLIILVGSAPAARAYSIPMVPIGAACDGIHDDTTAFENALTAAIATGGVLVIPLGTCIVNSSLVITGSVGIIGQGQKASILTTNSGAITQIVVNANNVILKGFQLTRTATATTGAQGISNLNSTAEPATGYSGLYIDDVRILNAHTGKIA